jgi:high-affinity Fe2+/Pb2+ permease
MEWHRALLGVALGVLLAFGIVWALSEAGFKALSFF